MITKSSTTGSPFAYVLDQNGNIVIIAAMSNFQVGIDGRPQEFYTNGRVVSNSRRVGSSSGTQYEIYEYDYVVAFVSGSQLGVTASLPRNAKTGQWLIIYDADGVANNRGINIVDPQGTRISGGTEATISSSYGSMTLYRDINSWIVINGR